MADYRDQRQHNFAVTVDFNRILKIRFPYAEWAESWKLLLTELDAKRDPGARSIELRISESVKSIEFKDGVFFRFENPYEAEDWRIKSRSLWDYHANRSKNTLLLRTNWSTTDFDKVFLKEYYEAVNDPASSTDSLVAIAPRSAMRHNPPVVMRNHQSASWVGGSNTSNASSTGNGRARNGSILPISRSHFTAPQDDRDCLMSAALLGNVPDQVYSPEESFRLILQTSMNDDSWLILNGMDLL